MSEPFVRKPIRILSPLRYPGAKRRLGPYIAEVLNLNNLRPKLFVEPFAGGASVALQLLKENHVDKIALGEKDPLIASFWKIVFNDPEWLIEQIQSIPVNMEKWNYFKKTKFISHRERALACLFLNRTSFSGILTPMAGPIGGRNQKSEYKIDCRFNVKTLVKRIRDICQFKNRVLFVDNTRWEKTIKKVESLGFKKNEVFYYLDPPFYEKARQLYTFYFDDSDHNMLHDALINIQTPWLLSYDPAKPIINKYSSNGSDPKRIGLLYSTARTANLVKAEELVITNLSNLPKITRLWRTSSEWKNTRNSSNTN